MYADRYARRDGIKPGSLIVAIAVNAGLIGALMVVAPVFEVAKDKRPLEIINIRDGPPPPPVVPEAKPDQDPNARAVRERVSSTTSIVPATSDYMLPPLPPFPPVPPLPTGEITRIDPLAPAPVLVDARVDPRYARDLQPAYPAGERRAEREGTVTLRVTIGADGRVADAECVNATSDEFCRVTTAQALAKWRFRPATRDGAAVPASKLMTVRFKLES